MSVFWKLRWFFKVEWRRYCIAVSALVIVGFAVLIPPWITGRVVDGIAEGTLTLNQLWLNVGIVLGVAVVSYVMRVVWRVSLFGASYALEPLASRYLPAPDPPVLVFFRNTIPAI